eukprot:NODE_1425_length_2481_cov_3.550127.p1 GENE.NODE_1425_length_2481_cov_3.550127~~NODE_1425_length_2481_cov_3.550127.p1  ORF type:complete len:323 (+),score=92.29 NODE_1425_length_2481_cov_3.550127:233-1201(+)
MADYMEEFIEREARFARDYDILEPSKLIGEGMYGKVYKARNRSTGVLVAMKEIKHDVEEEGLPSTAVREIALVKQLTHPNIIKLFDVLCLPRKLVIVFELIESDLKKYMKQVGGKLPPATVKDFSFQLCSGMEYIHAHRTIHRDLKPSNLLIDRMLRMKIADFGLARAYTVPVPKYTHEVVTVWYRAPELLLGSALYSIPIDIWSIGCILAEMVSGLPLFRGDSEIDTIFKVFQKLGTPTVVRWPELKDMPEFKPTFPNWPRKSWANIRNIATLGPDGISLLDHFLAYDPKKRMSARHAVEHAYFVDVDRSEHEERGAPTSS